MWTALVAAVWIGCSALTAFAAPCTSTCFVSPTGSDLFDGDTAGVPKLTIAAAIAQVNPGGQVNLAAGTYTASVVINKSLTLSGAGMGLSLLAPPTPGVGVGISIQASNATIQDLGISGFMAGVEGPVALNAITLTRISASNNTAVGFSFGGNVPYSNFLLESVIGSSNGSGGGLRRGFWMNGSTRGAIAVRDSTFNNNSLVGIDLSDASGVSSGLSVLRNTVVGNADSGIAVLAFTGPSANEIHGNTVTNNGRFGIEVKLCQGNGASSGAGSFTVRDNIVIRTAPATDVRDHAGIAVFRRSNTAVGVPFAEPPTGIWLERNIVSGYTRGPTGAGGPADGIGMLIEGTGHSIIKNVLAGNNIGLQIQSGGPGYPGDSPASPPTTQTPFFDRGNTAVMGSMTIQLNAICLNTDLGARKWEDLGGIGVTPMNMQANWWGTVAGANPSCAGANNCTSSGSGGNNSLTTSLAITQSNDTFLTTNGVCNVPAAPPVLCTPGTPASNKVYSVSGFRVSAYDELPSGSAPHYEPEVPPPPIAIAGNPISIAINPLAAQRFYYVRTSGANLGKVFYYDLASSAEVDAGYPTTLPSAARDSLAFSATGLPFSYDDSLGVIHNISANTSAAVGAVAGVGAPSALATDYKINDIALDGSGLMWAVGMHPRAAPVGAHLLRFNPLDATASHRGQLTLSPLPGIFPSSSSGLAFSPTGGGVNPQLVWTSSAQGSWIIDINSRIATKSGPNSANGADLGSCAFPIFVPLLNLSKSNGVATVTAAALTTYTLVISNTGALASSGTLTVVDVLPVALTVSLGALTLSGPDAAQWTCTAQTIATGTAIICTSTQTLTAAFGTTSFAFTTQVLGTATGTFTNRARLAGGEDPDLSIPSTTATVSGCTGSNTPTRGCAVDTDSVQLVAFLSINKANGAIALDAGSTTSYTVTLSNMGPSTVLNATLTDTVSAGLVCTQVNCTATTGPPSAACPSPLTINLLASGALVPSMAANTTVTLVITCHVTATGLP